MIAHDIVIRPVITEKSMLGAVNKIYTFEVAKSANKIEIAQAAEALFHVEVVKVNTVNCTGKTKRVGRFTGKKADFKKAIITINPETTKTGKDGKKLKTSIEFFDGMF